MKNFWKKSYAKATVFVLTLAMIDLIIKFLVIYFKPDVMIIENALRIVFAENNGVAWGMQSTSLLNVIVTNVIVLGIILKFINLQKDRIDNKTLLSLSLILAGGVSNLLERIIRGRVTDYIQFFPQKNFPVFNLADVYVIAGWILFAAILAYITGKRKTKEDYRKELEEEITKKEEAKGDS